MGQHIASGTEGTRARLWVERASCVHPGSQPRLSSLLFSWLPREATRHSTAGPPALGLEAPQWEDSLRPQ